MVKRANAAKAAPKAKPVARATKAANPAPPKTSPKARAPRKPTPARRKPVAPAVPKRPVGDVEAAVRRDVAEIAKRDRKLATSGLAASAIALGREIDIEKNSATSKSMCARALAETLERLRALAPPAEEADGIDDLAARRTARVAS